MDKFLQILEDGRMTDGQGNTVYFSETLIFFTSNAGISEEVHDAQGRVIERKMIVLPEDSYDKIQGKVEAALKTKFKPEVLNRIGKNIIVFNYITEAATEEILNKQLDNIIQGMNRKSKIEVKIDGTAVQCLMKKCLEKDTRENGGRGIGNVVESEFINPLAEFVFDSSVKPESVITVSSVQGKMKFEWRALND
jgi:ATP-dependent Clp protease ATP-binding subunit ClpA